MEKTAFHQDAKGSKVFHETLVQIKTTILTSDF